jgi:hypothetical protein
MGLVFLSRTLVCLGYVDQARLRKDEALAESRRLSSYPQAFALVHTSKVDWAIEGVKSPRATLRSAQEASEISGERGFPLWLSRGTIVRGWSLGAMGHSVEGISSILQGMALRLRKGANLGRPFCLALLADVYGMAAQPEEGLERITEAAEFVKKRKNAGSKPISIVCGGPCSSPRMTRLGQRTAFSEPSQWRLGGARNFGSCARPSTSLAYGVTKASALKPAIS